MNLVAKKPLSFDADWMIGRVDVSVRVRVVRGMTFPAMAAVLDAQYFDWHPCVFSYQHIQLLKTDRLSIVHKGHEHLIEGKRKKLRC